MTDCITYQLEPDRQRLRAVGLRRLGLIPVGGGASDPRRRAVFLAELAKLGFEVTNQEQFRDSALDSYRDLIDVLKEMRGGNVKYVPLFPGFPAQVPDQGDYFVRRVIGYLGNAIGCFEEGVELDNGVIVPEWLFDTAVFGADPITQCQDAGLFRTGASAQQSRESDRSVEWLQLEFVDWAGLDVALREFLQNSLYGRDSLKEALKPDIEYLLERFGTEAIDLERVVFKETRTYLTRHGWRRGDWNAVESLCTTPTDVLRLLAAVTESDTSLAEPIRFPKMTRTQRRVVMRILERCSNLAEDLVRYRGLWIAIGRGLHPGEMGHKYPRTAAAFDLLRNSKISTFNSRVELAAADGDCGQMIELLATRPGVFARRLHHLVELAGAGYPAVLAAFENLAREIPLKNLLVLEAYFRTADASPRRAVINKRGRIRVMDTRRGPLGKEAGTATVRLLRSAIERHIAEGKSSWQGRRVWIDERLVTYTIPLQQRKASDGLLNLGRGSQLPLELGKVLRLFVYWKQANQRTDLDLSLIEYDNDMRYSGHVSYTNLKTAAIVHSGDLQSAEHGAAEFIDIDLEMIREKKNIRYLATQVYRYCGDHFNQMQCHAGWMLRENVDPTYKSFDIKTVQQKFDLSGSTSYSIPIVIDLKLCRIVFVDIYVNGVGKFNQVEGAYQDISTITQEVVRMVETRPNLYDLAMHHARARGAHVVPRQDEADITIGFQGCDFDVCRVDQLLSEML